MSENRKFDQPCALAPRSWGLLVKCARGAPPRLLGDRWCRQRRAGNLRERLYSLYCAHEATQKLFNPTLSAISEGPERCARVGWNLPGGSS